MRGISNFDMHYHAKRGNEWCGAIHIWFIFVIASKRKLVEQFMSIRSVLVDNVVSLTEFKKNPMAVVEGADGVPVAVLNRNQPAFYCVPAEAYELLMEKLEDIELAQIVRDRQNSPEIEVSLDDL